LVMAMSMLPAITGVSVEAPPSVEDFDIEPGFLEVPLLQADIDEGAVPEAALRDRDLQRFRAGARRGRNAGQAHQQSKYRPHGVLPPNRGR